MKLIKTSYKDSLSLYKDYYSQFNKGIDGYYEKRILNGEHFTLIDEDPVGIVSINGDQLTGFYIFDKNTTKYSEYFNYILNQSIIKRILFSTIDTRLFKEIKERKFELKYQAYNFEYNSIVKTDFNMKLASKEHLEFIENNYLDFIKASIGISIEKFTKKIENSEVFIGYDLYGNPVSMGVIEQMILNSDRYCLGMIVLEKYRRNGFGVKTLKYLINYLQDHNLEVNARCWYYNEPSLRTLLKTGFEVSNLLLRVEDI